MLDKESAMKRPPFIHLLKTDWFRSLGVQTSLEIAAGGVLTAILLRWVMT